MHFLKLLLYPYSTSGKTKYFSKIVFLMLWCLDTHTDVSEIVFLHEWIKKRKTLLTIFFLFWESERHVECKMSHTDESARKHRRRRTSIRRQRKLSYCYDDSRLKRDLREKKNCLFSKLRITTISWHLKIFMAKCFKIVGLVVER